MPVLRSDIREDAGKGWRATQVVHIGNQPGGPRHPNGLNVEILVGEPAADGGNLATMHILLPPETQMLPHAHGQAETFITPLEGRMLLTSGEQQVTLEPGMLAVIAVGQQVGVENAATESASLPGRGALSASRCGSWGSS
jgi:quercetin dioxygenase-like cupin family protein